MRILFISSWYPNSVNPLKGLFVQKHAKAIQKAGSEVVVMAITINPSKKIYEKRISKTVDPDGMITHHIELNSRFYKFIHLDLIWQYGILKSAYKRFVAPGFKPDIVHTNVLYPSG